MLHKWKCLECGFTFVAEEVGAVCPRLTLHPEMHQAYHGKNLLDMGVFIPNEEYHPPPDEDFEPTPSNLGIIALVILGIIIIWYGLR